jgi:hypothetical protein
VTNLPSAQSTIAVKEFQFFDVGYTMTARIILKMGSAVWDWVRVHVKVNKPEEVANVDTLSGKLKVKVLHAVPLGHGVNPLPHAETVTRLILGRHGLGLEVNNTGKLVPGFEDGVIASFESWGNLNRLAEKLLPHQEDNSLLVVMANLRDEAFQNGDNHKKVTGVTSDMPNPDPNKPKKRFVVLNANVASVDGATLIHEMGHAANFCDHATKSIHSTTNSHFMSYGTMRNETPKGTIQKFAQAFFYSRG